MIMMMITAMIHCMKLPTGVSEISRNILGVLPFHHNNNNNNNNNVI